MDELKSYTQSHLVTNEDYFELGFIQSSSCNEQVNFTLPA